MLLLFPPCSEKEGRGTACRLPPPRGRVAYAVQLTLILSKLRRQGGASRRHVAGELQYRVNFFVQLGDHTRRWYSGGTSHARRRASRR